MRAKKGNQRGRQTGRKSATKVLYVEHDDDNLYMLKTRLERCGDFEVLTAEDSEQGCKLAVTERPDVILMDLEMPVMDRWEPPACPLSGEPRQDWVLIFDPLRKRGVHRSSREFFAEG
jgi:PleD family two-component response regulator